ncbi:MAG TPA: phosphoadenosine phosphosulfate reductase family protein [Chloroflexia bacterium]|nr:phosphoadenosine phosphosulfate reductase family protein [Chloroflexia bacterium]
MTIAEKSKAKALQLGQKTAPDFSEVSIYWCSSCNSPIAATDTPTCPNCGVKAKYLTTDVRPVFARERRILQFYHPEVNIFNDAIWKSSKSKSYYVNGKSFSLAESEKLKDDLPAIGDFIKEFAADYYDEIDQLAIIPAYRNALEVNRTYMAALEDDAFDFIVATSKRYSRRMQMVSFSGGKDSTVVSHLVRRALGNSVTHVFSDTTLEDENTYQYVQDFQVENPEIPFWTAKVNHDFHTMVEEIGPPSRVQRWCCTIFKAGPINNLLQTLDENIKVLTFYGVRNAESKQRADYNAITVSAKIGRQITASPIIKWGEFEVWAYILMNDVTFNKSYRLGYSRVGCWLCPLNSSWSDMLAEIFFPEDSARWKDQLVAFARKIQKPDPEEYIESGGWKARFGGAGMPNRFLNLEVKPCGDMDNTFQYNLERPVNNDELEQFLKPLGIINRNRGRAALGEFYVENRQKPGEELLVQALEGSDSIRISVLNPVSVQESVAHIKFQVTKYQECIQCTACAAVCPHGAISVRPEARVYEISQDRCTGCNECVTHFGTTGCLVAKSLKSGGRTVDDGAPLDRKRKTIPLSPVERIQINRVSD